MDLHIAMIFTSCWKLQTHENDGALETSHQGNASKKGVSNLKIKKTILTIFTAMAAALGPQACPSRSARHDVKLYLGKT